MRLFPSLAIGWLNGWLLLVGHSVIQLSRHPQIVALLLIFLGICLAIGSGVALLVSILSKLFQHFSILAEEEVCLGQYGEPYRAYMSRVPRYLWIL